MTATIGQKHKNGFKIVEIWDNHSESLKNNLYNDFKGPEHLLGGMNLENEIDTCQTTVQCCVENFVTSQMGWGATISGVVAGNLLLNPLLEDLLGRRTLVIYVLEDL